MDNAAKLWGRAAVRKALAEAEHEPITDALVREVERRADPPGAFRAWSLAQPWPRFCAVVRIVTGVAQAELMTKEAVNE